MGKEVGLCLMAGRLDSVAAAGERESWKQQYCISSSSP